MGTAGAADVVIGTDGGMPMLIGAAADTDELFAATAGLLLSLVWAFLNFFPS